MPASRDHWFTLGDVIATRSAHLVTRRHVDLQRLQSSFTCRPRPA